MSDDNMLIVPGEPLGAAQALDTARATFLDAFAVVPDAALGYLPEGDEYALGALPLHLSGSLLDYGVLLAQLAEAGDVAQRLSADMQASTAQHDEVLAARPTGADRARLLDLLGGAHDQFRAHLMAFPPDRFEQLFPVWYAGSTEPFPTSARLITHWLTDHYREHTAQVQAMLTGWEADQSA